MVDNSRGVKKSRFPASTIVADSSTFDFVYNGQNIKITKANLLAALGTTGTIVQSGDPTGTPVLNINGTENQIRNLVDGPGVKTSLTPLDGIQIEHNFVQDGVGTSIVHNLADSTPDFVSLLPGAGIQLATADNTVTITATGTALPATKAITINTISDFPTAVSGVITLEADTVYIISNDITTANRFVMQNNTTVTGYSILSPTLSYTGGGTMFTGVDADFNITMLSLNCSGGQLLDFTDTVGGVKQAGIDSVIIDSCTTIGTIDDYFVVFANVFVCLNIATDGITISGANYTLIEFRDTSLFSTNAGFTAIDLGTSVSSSIEINSLLASGPSGAVGIAGAASSANLSTGGFATVSDCSFLGAMTPLGTISDDDVQWVFGNSQGIQDTHPDSLSYLASSTTVTIASAGVPVKIGGSWTDESSSQHTVDGAGRVTFDGVRDFMAPITASITAYPVSGSNKDFRILLAKNGTVVTQSALVARASSSEKPSVTLVWQTELTNADYLELFLANDTDTVNFTVDSAILRVN